LDQGKTWTPPFRLSELAGDCVDDDTTVEGAVPTIGPNGELYVSWADQDGIKFDRSFDNGITWMQHDIFVTKQPVGWNYNILGIYRTNGLPITDCDRSNSKYKGSIYINWSDQLNGEDDTDIWLTVSKDSGKTWSKRKRVNDDKPGKHQFNSWMTIDQANGNIYILYYDRRNYDDENTDVYLAKSTNGGASFTNEKISEKSFDPNKSVFFGDYINISAHDNIVRPIWTRSDGKKTSVWTAIIGTK
ncbi:MAG TPA: sialidase family protein, partial [Chitinophagaceae bacterium]|nr:sialidase family protein [Chitinophagaceae bacterium]